MCSCAFIWFDMKSSAQANYTTDFRVYNTDHYCLIAMANVWWCVASGSGYLDCPADLAKTLKRGARVKAAAWRRPSAQGAEFFVAIAAEIQKCDDEPGARARYHVDFNKRSGTFGSKLPRCEKSC